MWPIFRKRVSGQKGSLAARSFVLAAGVALGGCTVGEIFWSASPTPAPDLSQQPNHRPIVSNCIDQVFKNLATLGTSVEISGVRPVDHLKGAAWLTCLKLDAQGDPQHYAIFIQGGKIIDWRVGVLLDQCHKEAYTPLDVDIPALTKRIAEQKNGARSTISPHCLSTGF
jgi:hypothetical protein